MKWKVSDLLAAACIAGTFSSATAADLRAETPADEAVDVEVVQAPKILSQSRENIYPRNEVQDGREGWVVLTVMIDSTGKAYERLVADSSGNPAFEKAALQSVDHMRFAPARRGDMPIDSSLSFKIKFAISNLENGASERFISAYKQLKRAIEAGDKAKADKVLSNLKAMNLYEEAFMNLGKYYYYKAWGTPAQQREALAGAIAGERDATYLPKPLFTTALWTKFKLELEAFDYGMALGTAKILRPLADEEMRKGVDTVVKQIREVRASGQPVRMSGVINARSSWDSLLLRNRFSAEVKTGSIREVKLVCSRKFLSFKFEPGVQYTIDAGKELCRVNLMGEPGSSFDFIQ